MQPVNNPVAKFARQFNKAAKHRNRKHDYSRKGKDRFDSKKVRLD